jgi:hypothetical protein
MLLKHPLTLGAHQHGEHLHPKPFAKKMKRKNWSQKDIQDLKVVGKATKINEEDEPKKQVRRGSSQTFVRLNGHSHKNQLGDKIIKSKKIHMGKAKNMNVVDQVREESQKIMQFESRYKFLSFYMLHNLHVFRFTIIFTLFFMTCKTHKLGPFPKCKVKFNYLLILGPLFWGFLPPRALHIKPELFYLMFKEGTLHP